ncbi:DoxX family membrane protein [Flavobacterium sp.]|uniref:DoxX family membrane protein n=1 Tax=Flavobacterium sp. TaxID=239 RepID=UPI0039E485B5
MRIATIIVRVLLGLMFLFASCFYFFGPPPPTPPDGSLKTFTEGLMASGYLMNLVKSLELICGLSFVIGRFVPLANLVILPISVNIFMTHAMVAPEGLPIAIGVLVANLFLIYAYRSHYTAVFAAK